jgi:hypothetical protein
MRCESNRTLQTCGVAGLAFTAVLLVKCAAHRAGRDVLQPAEVPLAELLTPEDTLVRVEKGESVVVQFPHRLSYAEAIAEAAGSDAVVVLEVRGTQPRLVKNDSWIETTVVGAVIDGLDDSAPCRPFGGDEVTLSYPAGETVLGSVTVRTGMGNGRLPTPGHRYFGLANCFTSPPTMAHLWEIDNRTWLRDMSGDGKYWGRVLDGRRVAQVLTDIRRLRACLERSNEGELRRRECGARPSVSGARADSTVSPPDRALD